MSWIYEDDCKPADLLKYDWQMVYYGYDVLHMQSIKNACDFIKDEYKVK